MYGHIGLIREGREDTTNHSLVMICVIFFLIIVSIDLSALFTDARLCDVDGTLRLSGEWNSSSSSLLH